LRNFKSAIYNVFSAASVHGAAIQSLFEAKPALRVIRADSAMSAICPVSGHLSYGVGGAEPALFFERNAKRRERRAS